MSLKLSNLEKVIMVGDRLLVKKRKSNDRTRAGLLLPPGVEEKDEIQTGYIMKVGPGYPIPAVRDEDEVWKQKDKDVQYVALQAREGDLAVFLQKQAFELEIDREKFYIVPHSAVLMLMRED